MNKKPCVELTLASNTNLISPTARYISKLFFESGTNTENKVCFAIEAMLEYRMSENKNGKKITVKVYEGTNHFYVQLIDKGIPYVLSEIGKKVLNNGLVDSYSISQEGKDGQQITLSFRYSYEHKESYEPKSVEEELLDDTFTCRLLTDSENDLLEAVRCIYSAYEYDYLNTDLYYLDALKRKLSSGAYYAIICENRHGQVVGHCALNNSLLLPNIPEFCTLVTKPIARGKGIAAMLLDYVQDFAKKKKYNGIMICPVAFHPFTQKISNKNGYVPCALNVSHSTAESRGALFMNGNIRANEAICIKLLNDQRMHKIYAPDMYRDYVCSILDALDSSYEYATDYEANCAPKTQFNSIVQKTNEISYISVTKVGEDFENKICELILPNGTFDLEMVGLYLNVGLPTPAVAFEALKKLGFKFNGFVPGASNGDFLYFQKLKKPYPLDTLVLEENYKKMSDELLKIQEKDSKHT